MRAVLQRVQRASVIVEEETVGVIDRPGVFALVGVTHDDTAADAATVARKIAELRILEGEESVESAGAAVLVVSQFTLYGSTKKGRRPSWSHAAPGDVAEPLVDAVVDGLRARGIEVATGRFGAHMVIDAVADGPVTVLVET